MRTQSSTARANITRPLLAAIFGLAITFTVSAEAAAEKAAQHIPAGYKLSEGGEINGDLNGDGAEDRVLVIQGTDKNKFEDGEDRNMRGILILFGDGKNYKLALENRQCLSPDNGGNVQWDKPGVSVSIKKGSLLIDYQYGGCGTNKSYNFRYRNSDFELIGFDWYICGGMGQNTKTSVNFLSKKKSVKVSGKETWSNIEINEPIKLRDIADFDEFDVMERIK